MKLLHKMLRVLTFGKLFEQHSWVILPGIKGSCNLFSIGKLILFDTEEIVVMASLDAGEIHHPNGNC